MQLFETRGADAAYDRWQEPPDIHEEDGCERCHELHREFGVLVEDCSFCQETVCPDCKGAGWFDGDKPDPEGPTVCSRCHGMGTI